MLNIENIKFCEGNSTKGKGCISVVYTKKNGNRVSFSKALIESIGTPSTVEIGFIENDSENYVVVGEELGSNQKYTLKKHYETSSVANIVYSKEVADKVVEIFNPNFNNVTTQTFGTFEVQDINGKKQQLLVSKSVVR